MAERGIKSLCSGFRPQPSAALLRCAPSNPLRGFSSLLKNHFFKVAEREGFEPPVPFSTTVFKTAAFDHSAISP